MRRVGEAAIVFIVMLSFCILWVLYFLREYSELDPQNSFLSRRGKALSFVTGTHSHKVPRFCIGMFSHSSFFLVGTTLPCKNEARPHRASAVMPMRRRFLGDTCVLPAPTSCQTANIPFSRVMACFRTCVVPVR